MKWLGFVIFFVICMQSLSAQIVNIENKRIEGEENGFSGSVAFDFSFTRTNEDILQTGSDVQLLYRYNRSRFLILNNFKFTRVAGQNLLNSGFQHLRYNYDLEKYPVTWEAFSQYQYNQIQKINLRVLNGTGPRFNIYQHDSLQLFAGVLYMYEYEELLKPFFINRDHRLSNYISWNWIISKNVFLGHVTYYQPLLKNFVDYRLSSDSKVEFNINKYLRFRIQFNYTFDANPPPGVQKTFFTLLNGIGISF